MAKPALIGTPAKVDFGDVQGIVRFGHGHLTDAVFLLLEIVDADAARSWLQGAPVTTAAATTTLPTTALQVAFTARGLEKLGLAADALAHFPHEFMEGMTTEESRSRRLGDIGSNAPSLWAWGGTPQSLPDLVVMLYALPDQLDAAQQAIRGPHWETAFAVQARLSSFRQDNTEPFGFVDGISQPALDWKRELAVKRPDQLEFGNVLALGEVLLGYPNEYGLYTDRPLLNPAADSRAASLLEAEDVPGRRDLGRNGSYLVLRGLDQDVRRFWQFVDAQAGGVPDQRNALAAAMVGRTTSGAPLVPLATEPIAGIEPAPPVKWRPTSSRMRRIPKA
jgi:deferrochelatase/peroxidase EfeB